MATDESAPDGDTAPSDETAPGTDSQPGDTTTPGADSAPDENAAASADGPASDKGPDSGDAPAASDGPSSGDESASDEPAAAQTARELADAGADALTEAAFRTGEFGPARELLQQAREAAAAAGDRQTEALALERLAMLTHYENITKLIAGEKVPPSDADAEEKLFRQALAIWQELSDQAGTARSTFGVGLVFQVLHDEWAAAMPYFWQALDLSRALEESGELYARSEIHRHVGFYYHVEADVPGEAVRHLQISLDLREEHGDPRLIPSALVALGEAELAAGNTERAIELLTRAVAEGRAAGLLQQRIDDAERALREAQATPAAGT
jgi:tetratricopeptide (TPR) repeat protein